MYFFTRAFIYIINVIASQVKLSYNDVWFPSDIVLSVTAMLVATVRPYKKTYMNVLDTLLLIHLGLMSHLLSAGHGFPVYVYFAQTFEAVILLPIACFFILGVWRIIQRLRETDAFHLLLLKCQQYRWSITGCTIDSQNLEAEFLCAEQPLLSPSQKYET